ncbi:restriction endonuclease subunit S [Comamonas aquatica]|uniref:EcoKI restriction-modification system protein HsdS n=1 Tax=Comamonas aquatica TaxID=225991 RepID=A0AA35D4Z6_9BURK|nr:restriction endonuclease subunit S [Comamonas aquatica]CAB5662430.1 EcoKI restriction-modification system protein HsdS [Comamonas aquatica]CAC9679744.1 EcoKI restriction-modification system protein HsdS [Comamonas aquatica]
MRCNQLPDDWHVLQIGNIGKVVTGNTPPKVDQQNYGSDVPWVSPFDMGTGKYVTRTRNSLSVEGSKLARIVPAGSVLVTCIASIGKNAIASRAMCTNQQINTVVVDARHCNEYTYYCIEQHGVPLLQKYAGRTAVPIVSKGLFEQLELPFPKSKAEQQKIAAILTAVDDRLDVIARQIEATQTLKQGLMQTLFSRGIGTQDTNGHWVPHTEFKETELGKIPAEWTLTTLGSVCDGALQTGPFGSQLHASEYQDEGIPVLMPKDLERCRAKLATAARISPVRAEELSKHKVFIGDLLFSRRGDVARFALIDEESEGALCGTGCLKARPTAAHSSPFLAQLLQLDVVRVWLEQNAVGQTMPNMNTGILSSLPLVMPVNRREQDEIARILESVDSKVQALVIKQSHFARLKRGLMQKLLTGEWRVRT